MKNLYWWLWAMSLLCVVSCGNPRKMQYLQGPVNDPAYAKLRYTAPIIQSGDILLITVYSDNPEASRLYNQVVAAVGTGGMQSNTAPGYPVDEKGNILFHSLGNIPVLGKTCTQVGEWIAQKFREANLLQNPYCQVKLNNFKFTVLGEVNRPAVYNSPNERVTLLEAIGLAGDLTAFGRRDSVVVIRELNEQRTFGWVDLRNPTLFKSDYYYLKQNDVVLIHPDRNKAAVSDQVITRNISLGLSIVSTFAIVYSLLTR